MRLKAALALATTMSLAAPAFAADPCAPERGAGWYGHRHHHGQARQSHHHRHGGVYFQAEEVVSVVEYREPYLPRGVLYNAPPLPVTYGYLHDGLRRDVISAKY